MNQQNVTLTHFGISLMEDPPCVHCGGYGHHYAIERTVHVDGMRDGEHFTTTEVAEEECPGVAEDEAREARILAAIAGAKPCALGVF